MMPFLTAANLNHATIAHGFFTREGGVSDGLYASLNCGYGSGDAMEKVRENRRRVVTALGGDVEDVIICHQVHSNHVHVLTSPPSERLEGDALVTNIPGLVIGVLTADCVPVLLADAEAGIVAAAHAGWRGTACGIVEQTVHDMMKLGADISRISAAIGPCIAGISYEVGQDVYDAFATRNAAFSSCFQAKSDGSHYGFDVGGAVGLILMRSGIANITRLDYDTYADEARFFSFRRATHRKETVYGRQVSAIMLRK